MVSFGEMGPDLEERALGVALPMRCFQDVQDTAGCKEVVFESHLGLSYCHGTPGGISGNQR